MSRSGRLAALITRAACCAVALSAAPSAAQAPADACASITAAIAQFLPSCPAVHADSAEAKPAFDKSLQYDVVELHSTSAPGVVFFLWSASYRGVHELYPLQRVGLWDGTRVGWITIDQPTNPYQIEPDTLSTRHFRLRVTDSLLFTDALDAELAKEPAMRTSWRKFLVRGPSTPLPVVLRTVLRDANLLAGAAVSNPRLRNDSLSFDWWLRFARVHREFRSAAILAPSVRDSAERIVAIADLPAARFDGKFQLDVSERLIALAPALVRRRKPVSDALALHLYLACAFDPRCGASPDLLLNAMPRYRGNLILALVASPTFPSAHMRAAQDSLARRGTNRNAVLVRAVGDVSAGKLAANPLLGLLVSFRQVGGNSWPVNAAVSTLDERFLPERRAATWAIAADSLIPDSLLSLLFRSLQFKGNWRLAQMLEDNPRVKRDTAYLVALAALDPAAFHQVPQIAGWALDRLNGKSVTAPPPRPPPPPPPVPRSRPEPIAGNLPPPPPPPPRYRRYPSRCLERDEWSDHLAAALGETPSLISSDSVCARLVAALDSVFILPIVGDSVYAFASGAGYSAAFAPPRAGVRVTLVTFDSTFAERARRSVLIP